MCEWVWFTIGQGGAIRLGISKALLAFPGSDDSSNILEKGKTKVTIKSRNLLMRNSSVKVDALAETGSK